MRSLQVLTPHKKCMFNCPFCISKSHKHNNKFSNNYESDYSFWESNIKRVLLENKDLKSVVITGTNEPMQDKDCVKQIIRIVRKYRSDIQLELQTRFFSYDEIYKSLDVVSYSISDKDHLDKIIPGGKISRFVILLTKSFNEMTLFDIIDKVPNKITQITFKKLINSNGINKKIDNWIDNNTLNIKTNHQLLKDINNYNGNLSIKYDYDCMDSKNRYAIFREDGNLYESWD